MDSASVLGGVQALAGTWAMDRQARQRRRALVPADFDALAATGILLFGVPAADGGLWRGVAQTVRPLSVVLRALAAADASVALVSSMHPSVLSFWLATEQVEPEHQAAWQAQRQRLSESARAGAWWGTITSEPGSGGDIRQTRSLARRVGAGYTLAGQKHFGSGSGITAYMMTTALPEGETNPDLFFMDVRDCPWDGSTGMTLSAEWDGHGMIATQSHGFRFDGYPLERVAWPGHLGALATANRPFVACLFTAVIVGIVETAVATARTQLERRRGTLRGYERVEWVRADMESWLIVQAFEGMLRAVEEGREADLAAARGKTAIAEMAGTALERLCRVMGGGSYARYSPFGFWAQDVRALGFLRPPWALAYDALYDAAFS